MSTATITRIDRKTYYSSYRIEGKPEQEDWLKSFRKRGEPDCTAYCEITLSRDGEAIASFGGSVWPGAWPSLFKSLPASVVLGSGRTTIATYNLPVI